MIISQGIMAFSQTPQVLIPGPDTSLPSRFFEYLTLRALRPVVNKFVIWFARKYGVIINGTEETTPTSGGPWHHLRVHHPNTLIRILNQGSLGLGESYMDGWWDCDSQEDLIEFSQHLLNITGGLKPHFVLRLQDWIALSADEKPWELSSKNGWARPVGVDFHKAALGPSLNFNAGIWRTKESGQANNLEEAQQEAMKQMGIKLKLVAGMKVLELGCGYGGLARYLADAHDVFMVGVTHSADEATAAQKERHPNVEIVQSDFRKLPPSFDASFDRVVVVHLMEHLGSPRHYREFFETAHKYLKPGGLFLLQTYVTCEKLGIRRDPLNAKYMFSSTVVPFYQELMTDIKSLFTIQKLDDLSENLEIFFKTTNDNFDNTWRSLPSKPDQRYYRLMKLVSLIAVAMGRVKLIRDWVLVLEKMETSTTKT